MKSRLMVVVLMMWVSITVTRAENEGKHLFILSGQSNMAGLNPNTSFSPAVVDAFGLENVIVVKDAQSGQPIRRWVKGWKPASGDAPASTGDLYDRLVTKVLNAIKGHSIRSVTFVWMQGERDAREKHGEVYAKSLKDLTAQIAKDLQKQDINVVIGRLSDFDMENARYPHWTLVREEQVAAAESNPHWAWVNTDDLNNKVGKDGALRNDLHYTREGYRALGERFAKAAIALVRQ